MSGALLRSSPGRQARLLLPGRHGPGEHEGLRYWPTNKSVAVAQRRGETLGVIQEYRRESRKGEKMNCCMFLIAQEVGGDNVRDLAVVFTYLFGRGKKTYKHASAISELSLKECRDIPSKNKARV